MSTESVTVPLSYPIESGGKTVDSITVRRPLLKDLIAAERQPGEIGQEAAVLSECSGISLKDLGQLDAADYRRIIRETELGFISDAAEPQAPSGGPESQEAPGAPS